MPVTALPSSPGPARVGWTLIDHGGTQGGVLGGSSQRINRLGNRWRCEVVMPPMAPALAREWAAALAKGLRTGVSMKVREVSTPAGSPGAVLVAGADQVGFALDVDGGTSGHVVQAGKWFSIPTGGRRYLYQVNAVVQLSGTGTGTIAIEPALRVSPADDSAVELAAPVIEGLLTEAPAWALDETRMVRGFSFVIEESA